MPCKTQLPVAGDRGVRIRLPPRAGLSWCGALLSAVVRGSSAPFLGSSSRGTEGSNPSPSSAESSANPISWIVVGAGAREIPCLALVGEARCTGSPVRPLATLLIEERASNEQSRDH